MYDCSVASSSSGKLMNFKALFSATRNAATEGATVKFMAVMC